VFSQAIERQPSESSRKKPSKSANLIIKEVRAKANQSNLQKLMTNISENTMIRKTSFLSDPSLSFNPNYRKKTFAVTPSRSGISEEDEDGSFS